MEIFKNLEKEENYLMEDRISKRWNEIDILNKTIKNREGNRDFVFYDGPIYANGLPVIRYTKLIFSNFLLNQGIIGYSRRIQNT